MKYPQQYDGEWVRPVMKGYKIICCDCGLVHKINFKHVKRGNGKEIMLQAFRDDRATAAIRREAKKRVAKAGGANEG